MSFSQRQQLTQPFNIATMRQQGYLLELAPSFQSWFICFFDDRWRQSGLNQATIERNARDFDWSLDLLRRGHSPANQWAALGPFQGLRKLYHYYRGTSVGMGYISDDSIYNHLAAAMANGRLEVHRVYDPHDAYRAWASGVSSSTTASSDNQPESKPETKKIASGSQSSVPASQAAVHEGQTAKTSTPTSVQQSITEKRFEPQSIEEALAQLQKRRSEIKENGFSGPKYTEEELDYLVQNPPKDRFLVRFVFFDESAASTATLGRKRPDSGRAPYWTTTLDAIESADTDPVLIAGLLGIDNVDAGGKYGLVIIDSHALPESACREDLIPTFDNLANFSKKELSEYNYPDEIIDSVMSDEYVDTYRKHTDKLVSENKNIPYPLSNKELCTQYAIDNFETKREREQFLARNTIDQQLGATPLFSGNGKTEMNQDFSRKHGNQKSGSIEILTFERDSLTMGELGSAVKYQPLHVI